MRPDPLAHLRDVPFFPSWPFAVAHQDLVTVCVLLFGVVAGIVLLVVAVASIVWLSWFFYDLDRFFFPDVLPCNPGPLVHDPVASKRAERLEVAMRSMQRKAADLASARTPPAPEPPPANTPRLWLMPFADLWYERCVESDGHRRHAVVTPQARALFDAWVSATGTRASSTHHVDRELLYKDYECFAFEALDGFRDYASTFLLSRDFWPLLRERLGVRDTTYGRDARWCNRNRTVRLYSATVPPKYDSTPSALRAVGIEAMAETQAAAHASVDADEPAAPVARARKRL
ncbi:hypothetical protein LGM54_30600 [Burkholderia cenocepacia]|uniref:hypothetical protein n=1 Tax=Burkholderia cenocepacia TaxID=95486 RepID=UPI001CF48B03|nr:hypothetical protein [Burkholderia cenocepacia]MCA7967336.1 hypothetical protein [Burkholderia cenocepacia]